MQLIILSGRDGLCHEYVVLNELKNQQPGIFFKIVRGGKIKLYVGSKLDNFPLAAL